ncbi:uncharacterized protein [Diabrotica undecimpunctata]|uniref:uncharacterized protein isoform X2 n=1 Tax=Diabrotica undecimpunctata TaxID=50387 RepID=UPI003B634D80
MDTTKIDSLLKDIKKQFKESDKILAQTVAEELDIPQDISLIQNKCDNICNDLKQLRNNMEERLILVNKTDFIMNILNYKLYEVQYDFSTRIKKLKDIKKQLENTEITSGNESKIALNFVENDKEITECEQSHEQQHKSVRQQMLEAQECYEKSANVLDDCLEVLKKNFTNLILLLEAHKRLTGNSNLEETIELDELKEMLDGCTLLASTGWRTPAQDLTDFTESQKLIFTEEGLLVTHAGREVTYDEAVEIKLLDNLKLVDLFQRRKPKEEAGDVRSVQGSEESTESTASRMSSQDVSYLKEHLGTPLTLALAEITAIQPRDPIHYLGHWLFKYRYNEEVATIKQIEISQLTEERERLAKIRWHKILEEEAKTAVMEMIVKAEDEAIRKELLRIEREIQEAEEHEEQLAEALQNNQ